MTEQITYDLSLLDTHSAIKDGLESEYATHVQHTSTPGYAEAGSRIIDKIKQAEETAIDLHNFGAIALASEIETSHIANVDGLNKHLPTTVTNRDLKKKLVFDLKSRLVFEVDPLASNASAVIADANNELEMLVTGDAATTSAYVRARVNELRKEAKKHTYMWSDKNLDMLLDGASISPFLTAIKEQAGRDKGLNKDSYKWTQWLNEAPSEQLVNFAQWYTEKLKIIANKDDREEYTAERKQLYCDLMNKAAGAGWLSNKFAKVAKARVKNADVMYFSAFGNYTTHFGGATQKGFFQRDTVALSSISSDVVDIHEYGHIASVIDPMGFAKAFKEQDRSSAGELYTIINEGYNDHLTAALLQGDPEIIIPSERHEHAGGEASHGHSDRYEQYREIFGLLVAGKNKEIKREDIVKLADSAASYKDFAAFMSERWDGRDMISEMQQAIAASRKHNPSGVAVIADLKLLLHSA